MRFVGIDPGLYGAVAVLPDAEIFDTPIAEVRDGSRRRNKHLPREMFLLLERVHRQEPITCAALENVHSWPGMGVVPAFGLGHALGLWEMALAALAIPYELIRPQDWKKAMMQGMGKEKGAARVRAQQIFPSVAGQLSRVRDDGRAEALLMAEFIRRKFVSK
jgi:crossover junction endodeoxyribonuclease RuvC